MEVLKLLGMILSEAADWREAINGFRGEAQEVFHEKESVIKSIPALYRLFIRFLRMEVPNKTLTTFVATTSSGVILGSNAAIFVNNSAGAWVPIRWGGEQVIAEYVLAFLVLLFVATNLLILFMARSPSARVLSLMLLISSVTFILISEISYSHAPMALFVAVLAASVAARERASMSYRYRNITLWGGRTVALLLTVDFIYFITSYYLESDLIERIGSPDAPPTVIEVVLSVPLLLLIYHRYNKALGKELQRI